MCRGWALSHWGEQGVQTGATFFLEGNLSVCNKSLRALWAGNSTSILLLGLSLCRQESWMFAKDVCKDSLYSSQRNVPKIRLCHVFPPSLKMLRSFLVRLRINSPPHPGPAPSLSSSHPLQYPVISFCSSCQAWSSLRVFALAAPSAWDARLP